MNEKKFNYNIILISTGAVVIFISLIISLTISFVANLSLNQNRPVSVDNPTKVDIVILSESSCSDCFNLTPVIDSIKAENVKIKSEKAVYISTKDGQELLAKYNITKIPSLLVSGDFNKNDGLNLLFSKWGEIIDKTFVLRQIGAPYFEVETSKVRGQVQLTMLVDTECSQCYDVNKHEAILKQYGFVDNDSKVLNITLDEGKALIDKYNIKLLPTIVLTGDLDAYPSLIKAWLQVGTVESDGTYIFRDGVKQMGVYKDISTGEIITPQPKVTPNQQ